MRKFLFSLVVLVMCFVAVEVLLRIIFSIKVGPDVLLYGITPGHHYTRKRVNKQRTVNNRKVFADGYFTYPPNAIRYDIDHRTQKRFRVAINSHGFRGEDYKVEKPEGVLRVVTLGASSTFGYFARDNETYPYYLEQRLNSRCRSDVTFEVINLGMPHAMSHEIVAILRNEALPLKPDLITFYEGVNDSARKTNMRETIKKIPLLHKAYLRIHGSLLTVKLLDSATTYRQSYTRADVKKHLSGLDQEFVNNLSAMHSAASRDGIRFVVMTQQAQSKLLPRSKRRGVTYDDEQAMVWEKLDDTGTVKLDERSFLAHHLLMKALRSWAEQHQVPLVDILRVLDDRRDVLLSWVHLSPEGNRMIADALADEIINQLCPTTG